MLVVNIELIVLIELIVEEETAELLSKKLERMLIEVKARLIIKQEHHSNVYMMIP